MISLDDFGGTSTESGGDGVGGLVTGGFFAAGFFIGNGSVTVEPRALAMTAWVSCQTLATMVVAMVVTAARNKNSSSS